MVLIDIARCYIDLLVEIETYKRAPRREKTYDEETNEVLKNFKYKNMIFKDTKTYNWSISNNNLYLNFNDSDIYIKVFEGVNTIINKDGKRVVFLAKNELYSYEFGKGYKKLAKSLEWEFHFNSQIYVFNW